VNFNDNLYCNSRESEHRLVCKVAGGCEWLAVGLANTGYVVWLCVVVDRLALICWQLIWLLVTVCGTWSSRWLWFVLAYWWSPVIVLYHFCLFFAILSKMLRIVCKLVLVCTKRNHEKQWYQMSFLIVLSNLLVKRKFYISACQNQLTDFADKRYMMFINCLVVFTSLQCNKWRSYYVWIYLLYGNCTRVYYLATSVGSKCR